MRFFGDILQSHSKQVFPLGGSILSARMDAIMTISAKCHEVLNGVVRFIPIRMMRKDGNFSASFTFAVNQPEFFKACLFQSIMVGIFRTSPYRLIHWYNRSIGTPMWFARSFAFCQPRFRVPFRSRDIVGSVTPISSARSRCFIPVCCSQPRINFSLFISPFPFVNILSEMESTCQGGKVTFLKINIRFVKCRGISCL